MKQLVRYVDSTTSVLGPNRVEAIAGTSKKARDGHILEMRGMDTSAFIRSGTILWGHQQDRPVGVPVSGRVDSAGDLRLVIDFAPEGASQHADEIRSLVKAGIVRNLSVAFDVIEAEPLDARNPRGGLRITRSELLEVSFVSVPADTGAVVTARAGRSGKVLSGANAEALRAAHDHAEAARSAIADVLAGAGEGDGATGGVGDREWRLRQAEVLRLAGVAHLHGQDVDYDRRQREVERFRLSGVAHLQGQDGDYARRQLKVERLRLAGAAHPIGQPTTFEERQRDLAALARGPGARR